MGDLFGGGPVCHLLQDLGLPSRQRGIGTVVHVLRLFDEGAGQRGMDHRLALHGQLGGLDQLIGADVFQEIPGHPRPHGVGQRRSRLLHCEQDDLRLRGDAHDLPRRFDPADPGHADVHEDDLGRDLLDRLHGLLTAGRLSHDLHFTG